MKPPTCRKCHRPIGDTEKYHGWGPKCWRKVNPTLDKPTKPLGRGRRNWATDMPGQELLDIEVSP
jgi:hypothetical protein